jgi:hypothetical protein
MGSKEIWHGHVLYSFGFIGPLPFFNNFLCPVKAPLFSQLHISKEILLVFVFFSETSFFFTLLVILTWPPQCPA